MISLGGLIRIKFIYDSLWTVLSNVITSSFGILLNLFLLKYYNAEYLGKFNFSLAIFFFLLYPALLGLNSSIIKFISDDNFTNKKQIFSIGFYLTILFSIIITMFSYLSLPLLEVFYKKIDIIPIFSIFLLSLPLYSINKYLINYCNGIRRMKSYSIFNALRFVLMFLFIILFHIFDFGFYYFSYSILLTEIILFFAISLDIKLFSLLSFSKDYTLTKKIIGFGFLNFVNDLFIDLYSKTDILIIGFLLNPYLLGIYVFASDIAKGISMFSGVIQVNFNPIIAKLWSNNQNEALFNYTNKVKKHTYLLFIPILFLSIIGYLFLLKYVVRQEYSHITIVPYLILLVGFYLFSAYQALLGLLTYTGNIKSQLIRIISTTLFNIILSYILINIFGIIGAAVSTTISLVFTIYMFKFLCKKRLKITI